MVKLCPHCGKEFSKGKICPICNTPLITEKEVKEAKTVLKKGRWHWYDAVIVLVALLAIYLILIKVTIGYVVDEPYTVQERYEETEEYNVTEPYTIVVLYTVTQLVVDYEPYTPEKTTTKETCYYKDTSYTINYEGGLQNPYNPATETGYRFKNLGISGEYVQKVEICHPPTRKQDTQSGFHAVFAICNYMGETKVDCPNNLITTYGDRAAGYAKQGYIEDKNYPGVYSTNKGLICMRKEPVVWQTTYDVRKSIRLEPLSLPQIRVCENEEVSQKVNLYTEAGQKAEQPMRPVEREITKTQYKNETQFKDVTKTRKIEKFRDVAKIRYSVKQRTLWEELRLQYHF